MPVFYIRRPSHDDCQIYSVNIDGAVFTAIVTASPDVASQWVYDTINNNEDRRNIVVGFAVQWNRRAGNDPPAETLQLCVHQRCLIFQLSRADHVPRALRQFLLNQRCIFVSLWRYNGWMLWRSRHELRMGRNPLNLRDMMDDAVAPVERIVESYLGYRGVRLRRHLNLSDWGRETLSDAQAVQASIVPRCAYLIGMSFRVWQSRDTLTSAHMEPSHIPSTVENIEEEDPTQNPAFAHRSGSEKKVADVEPKAQRKIPSIFEELKIDPFEDDDVFEEFEINEEYDDEDEGEAVTQPWEDDWDDQDDSDDFSLELRRELEKVKEKEKNTDDKN